MPLETDDRKCHLTSWHSLCSKRRYLQLQYVPTYSTMFNHVPKHPASVMSFPLFSSLSINNICHTKDPSITHEPATSFSRPNAAFSKSSLLATIGLADPPKRPWPGTLALA